PELIMYVSVSKPKLSMNEQGHSPVAHIFTNVMQNGLRYLNIAPDIESEQLFKVVNMPEVVGKNTEKMTEQLKNEGLKVTVIGDGNRIDSSNIREGEEIFSNDHVFLVTDKPKMPNIKGWSLREVLQLSHLLDLQIETVGEGYVSIQSIEKGS